MSNEEAGQYAALVVRAFARWRAPMAGLSMRRAGRKPAAPVVQLFAEG